MRIIWIGDQRSKQLKYWQDKDEEQQTVAANPEEEKAEREFEYILDNNADASWLSSFAIHKATELFDTDTAVIISSGLNDCINSCLWSNFSILDLAQAYVDEINALTEQSTDYGIYFCTVAPVNANIPRADAPLGYISISDLNEKIVAFNNHLKNNCKATVIDCHQYLTDTSFATRDGLLFTADTCLHVSNYILNSIKTTYTKFPARLTAPPLDNSSEENKFWTWTSHGGLNVFILDGNKNVPYTGCALPNCTAYAWGRFYELIGEKPKLPTSNAENWFGANCSLSLTPEEQAKKGTAYDGYARGFTPKEGAVICWEGRGDRAGHVAIVEKVISDSEIIVSESGWQSYVWRTKERNNDNGNWGQDTDLYRFLGFIYCPATTVMGPTVDVKKENVISNDKYLSQSEMEINAMYVWHYLGGHKEDPWTLNAVAGLLGNMEKESTLNPGLGERGGSGFGLVQWTPKSKYTNWLTENYPGESETDIDYQLERIIWEKDNGKQYGKHYYPYTFKEFAVSNDSAYDLACAFVFDYERPGMVIWGFHTDKMTRKSNYCKKSSYDTKCETDCKACLPCYLSRFGEARTAQQKEKNRDDLKKARGGAAEKWFKYLLPYAPGTYFEEKFVVTNLKVDSCTETSATLSLLTSNAKSGSATLYDENGKSVHSKKLSVATDSDEEPFAVVSFSFSKLIPNKYYSLKVTIDSALNDGETTAQVVDFTTKQSRPKQVSVSLKTKQLNEGSRIGEYQVNWTSLSDSDWGYWKTNARGFVVSFFKNGQTVKTALVSSGDTSITFKPTEIYSELKLDDSIQVGVNPWVNDDGGNRVYAEAFPRVSESIKFLKQPIRTYLNIK